jgi:pyruvate kinase
MMNLLRRLTGSTAKVADNGPVLCKAPARAVNFHVTLWPEFDHFSRFAQDPRVQGIRLNSAMMEASEINDTFVRRIQKATMPLWFDIKGMQMRIREIVCGTDQDHLEFILNRPVNVKLPCAVWFKAGEDCAKLVEIKNGTHFIFEGGPRYEVKPGESIHILERTLEVGGEPFLPFEREKIEKVKGLGINHWCLSYAYDQKHIDEFREMIGPDAHLYLKIENIAGLSYVANKYRPMPLTNLFTARGDMFIEIPKPHHILKACKLILERDPDALVGSRMLLSLVETPDYQSKLLRDLALCFTQPVVEKIAAAMKASRRPYTPVPSAADLSELAWLYDIGYRTFLLCDELCLKEHMLAAAVNVFDAFRKDYCDECVPAT